MCSSFVLLVLCRLSNKGADRYDIHLQRETPPTVRDLFHEVEKKTRVSRTNQQLVFRGNQSCSLLNMD
jgi:hypothetical protein